MESLCPQQFTSSSNALMKEMRSAARAMASKKNALVIIHGFLIINVVLIPTSVDNKPTPAKTVTAINLKLQLEEKNVCNKEVQTAAANATMFDIERTLKLVRFILTWARTSALSLKSQKIKSSYEMRWLERN